MTEEGADHRRPLRRTVEPCGDWTPFSVDRPLVEVLDLARTIEPLAVAAWPARETVSLDGWIFRFTDGFSHRGNSVATLEFTPGDVQARLTEAERAYAARRLAPMFHLTPVTQPDGLERVLVARGYRSVAPTHVWVARTASVVAKLPAAGTMVESDPADPRFRDLVTAGSRSQADGSERLEILGRLAHPHVRVVIMADEVPVACGVGVKTSEWVSIYVMRSAPGHRRRGHARRALAALAAWAGAHGAPRLFLQVEDDNTPARQLYAGAGFVPAYPYSFYLRG